MTAEEHRTACLDCRRGVNCIEWYKLGAPSWCSVCDTDHFVTPPDEAMYFNDVFTDVRSRTLIVDRVPMIHYSDNPNHGYFVLPVSPYSGENLHWARGHLLDGSEEADVLRAACALTADQPPLRDATGPTGIAGIAGPMSAIGPTGYWIVPPGNTQRRPFP